MIHLENVREEFRANDSEGHAMFSFIFEKDVFHNTVKFGIISYISKSIKIDINHRKLFRPIQVKINIDFFFNFVI